ncbi:unnamed protein product [Blepharisma stoltei]|uniref:Uncharacterized protein n=1 Tax=Blepharisma stoltei TaxID=1481888 RepID=A0AAU9J143_9CILI|nr:unnamed protein product [Blepharisma stoltei]
MLYLLFLTFNLGLAQHPKITLDGPSATVYFLGDYDYSVVNSQNFTIEDSSNNNLLTITQSDSCNITANRRIVVHGDLLASNAPIKIQNYDQWQLVALEDFQGQLSGWSDSSVSNCGSSPNIFLGGHCKYSDVSVSKTFTIPSHSYIKVSFNVNFLDRWEGESVYMKLDSNIVWNESYQACNNLHSTLCQYKGIDSCGDDYPDRIGHPVTYSGVHSADSVTLEFSSTLDRDSCEVSWGIDDLEIYIR